jgi:hypothetical protein
MNGQKIRHDGALAWGWWMRTVGTPNGGTVIVDEEGREWRNMRQALWAGRLGMSLDNPVIVNEGLELLLAVLASRSRGIVGPVETSSAIFGHDRFYRMWTYWILSTGLVELGDRMRIPFDAMVSAEGASVIRMLVATRSPELAAVPIGREALKLFGEQGSTTECNRDAFDAAEAALRRFPYAMVRENRFGQHLVAMLHRDRNDPIPMARTIWSLACPDAASRDRLHRWMHDRLDRWSHWGEIVVKKGPHSLTQHLLTLIVVGDTMSTPTPSQQPTGTQLAIPHRS